MTVFEALPKPGGLNEYGLATYKTVDGFAQQEIDWLLSIGGISIRSGMTMGEHITLAGLRDDFDAVFLGLGLGGVNALGLALEQVDGVGNAVEFIAGLRQASDLAALPVGRHVVVIGGGMTAVDAAVQSRKLGAEQVTIVYRREQQRMSASAHEQAWAQTNGVTIRTSSVLTSLQTEDGHLTGVTFKTVHDDEDGQDGIARPPEQWSLAADTLLKAIGQTLLLVDPALARLAMYRGRISVDAEGRTTSPNVWAGGDCTFGGHDLTVEAVEHGKIAAHSIDHALGSPNKPVTFTRLRRAAA